MDAYSRPMFVLGLVTLPMLSTLSYQSSSLPSPISVLVYIDLVYVFFYASAFMYRRYRPGCPHLGLPCRWIWLFVLLSCLLWSRPTPGVGSLGNSAESLIQLTLRSVG